MNQEQINYIAQKIVERIGENDGEKESYGKENIINMKKELAIKTGNCPVQTHNFHIARHGKCQDCGGTDWMDAPAPAQEVEIADWTRNYLSKKYPTISEDDMEGDELRLYFTIIVDALTEYTAGSRWQQGQQGSNEDWQRQYSDLLEWTVMLIGPLKELVELKQIKDEHGKTADYEERQPKAWYMARVAVAMWEERGNYGLKLKHEIPTPSHTIGARWVMLTGKSVEQLPGGYYFCKVGPVGDKVVWTKKRIIEFFEDRPDSSLYYLDESPATFPTREQAEKWVSDEYDESVIGNYRRRAALAMYDWIAEKIKTGQ